ncbi:MAG: hypothetical protein U1F53_14075 [Burkholderiaceae bacterium]
MPPRPRRPLGLTRLEALVCVALVGVLLAVALPRLAATRVEARQVRLKMLLATARSSAALFHGRCEILSTRPGEACERLTLDGQPVRGVNEWPAASADGIAAALKVWGPTADIDWQPERIEGVPALRARLTPTSVAGTCEFIYAQAASPGAGPRIELVDASCP